MTGVIPLFLVTVYWGMKLSDLPVWKEEDLSFLPIAFLTFYYLIEFFCFAKAPSASPNYDSDLEEEELSTEDSSEEEEEEEQTKKSSSTRTSSSRKSSAEETEKEKSSLESLVTVLHAMTGGTGFKRFDPMMKEPLAIVSFGKKSVKFHLYQSEDEYIIFSSELALVSAKKHNEQNISDTQ